MKIEKHIDTLQKKKTRKKQKSSQTHNSQSIPYMLNAHATIETDQC